MTGLKNSLKGGARGWFRGFLTLLPVLVALCAGSAAAQQTGPSGLPVPRFVSLRDDEVNMRRGPSVEHAIEWVYRNFKGLPVKVIAETELWRKVEDHEGVQGWIHKTLLQAERTAIVRGKAATAVRARPNQAAKVRAYAKPGAIGTIEACEGRWCRVEFETVKGWLVRYRIWGALPDETLP